MRVLITGSRHGHPLVERWLTAWVERHGEPWFVLGDATGVDAQAMELCEVRGWSYDRVTAVWALYGNRAGPERNGRMVALCEPGDVCLAFPAADSRGTRDCVRKARAAGLVVYAAPEKGGAHDPIR